MNDNILIKNTSAALPVNVIDSIIITEERDLTKVLAEWSAFDPDITTYGQMISGQAVKLFINWSDGGGATTLQQDDYFTFVIPEIFRHESVSTVTDAAITTTSGEIVATYSIYVNENNLKEVKITFTDYVNTHSDIHGDFWLLLFVGKVDTSETKIIEFIINGDLTASGETTVIPSPGTGEPHNEKYGHSALGDIYNGYYIFNWVVRLNMEEDTENGFHTLDGFRFEDVIPEGSPHVFLTDEIRQQLGLSANQFPLRVGEYGGADSYPPQDRYELFKYQYNSSGINLWSNYINYVPLVNGYTSTGIDGGSGLIVSNLVVSEKSLSADLGRLTRPTSIQYCTLATVKIAESALGDTEVVKLFSNTFKSSYGEDITASLTVHRFESGGTAQGISGDYGFSFTKINEKGGVLAGAMFSLYTSPDFSGGADRFVFSDNNGIVSFDKLPEGTYYVREEAAPYSYILDTSVYKVVLTKDSCDIYYGSTFENNLKDNENKISNKLEVPPSCSVILRGTKFLTGKVLADNMFDFVVKNAGGTTVATGTNDATGSISFSKIDFTLAGDYTFTVQEVRGAYGGITYDSSAFTVTVSVTDDGSGNLLAEISYPAGGIVFNNRYFEVTETPCVCPTRTTRCRKSIKGKKIWIDDNNSRNTRPPYIDITLLRNGTEYKKVTVATKDDASFIFCCLPIWNNSGEIYDYQIMEATVPGYTAKIEGYVVTNTLNP